MFERMDISEYIYEGVVEPSYKKLLGKNPTVLVTSGKRGEKPPHHRITLGWVRVLASAEKICRSPAGRIKNLSYPQPREFFR